MNYSYFLTVRNNAAMNTCELFMQTWLSVFLSVYLRVELQHHMVTNSEKLPNSFPKWLYHFTFLQAMSEDALVISWVFLLLTLAILMGMKWYFIVVLMCISLMTNEWSWTSSHVLSGFAICIFFEKCLFSPFPTLRHLILMPYSVEFGTRLEDKFECLYGWV